MSKFFPDTHQEKQPRVGAAVIGGGAIRSRTGLTGFAIGYAHSARAPHPGVRLRADRAERLFCPLLGKVFPDLGRP